MPRKRRPSRKRSKRKRGGSSCQDGGRRMRGGGGIFDSITNAFTSAGEQLKNAAGEASAAAVRTTDSVKGAVSTVQAGASQTGKDIGDRATNLQNVATTGKTTEQLNKEKEEAERAAMSAAPMPTGGPGVSPAVMPTGGPGVSPVVMPRVMSEEEKLNQHVLSNRGGSRRKSKRRKTRRKSKRKKRRKTRRKSKRRRKRRTRRK